MSSAATNVFTEWSLPWGLTAVILAFAAIYVRGWFAIRKTRKSLFPDWRLFSYLLGLLTLWLSICSPLDGFADALLSAHMVEHLILMSLVPPLVLLGYPAVPILRGLPAPFVRIVLGPILRSQKLLRFGRFLTKPVTAWLLMNVAFLLWHIPTAYDLALENERLHDVEHLCFLGTSFLFWWPIIQPWPAKRHDYGWMLLPYLLTADFINTALSAYLAFCDRPIYTFYLQPANNPFHAYPLADQVLGAGFMWVVGSIAFLLPAVVITVRMLQGKASSSVRGNYS